MPAAEAACVHRFRRPALARAAGARGSVEQSNIPAMAPRRMQRADKDRRAAHRPARLGACQQAEPRQQARTSPRCISGWPSASIFAGVALLSAISVVANSALSATKSRMLRWPSPKTFLNSKAGCRLWLRAYTLRSPGTMNESDALACGQGPKATVCAMRRRCRISSTSRPEQLPAAGIIRGEPAPLLP